MRKATAGVLVGLVWLFGGLMVTGCELTSHNEPVIVEDDPRWDCRTMGNKICGSDIASAILDAYNGKA